MHFYREWRNSPTSSQEHNCPLTAVKSALEEVQWEEAVFCFLSPNRASSGYCENMNRNLFNLVSFLSLKYT